MSSLLCCCFRIKSSSKFTITQHKDEYKKKKQNMAFIGNNKPKSVYYGYLNELKNSDIILGLNSLCLCDIAISNSPPRLILSYINFDNQKLLKSDTFHIFNINYKVINDINDIYKTIPDNSTNLIIPC